MTFIRMDNVDENPFVNMDETAVDFETHHNHAVNEKGAKTVSVRDGCSDSKRSTVCTTVAADRTNLPLLVIFTGPINEPIANSLH